EIWLNDKDVTRIPPEERNVGYVPQDYKLFPHLTVEKNIIFGLRNKNELVSKNDVQELMDLVEISHLSKRKSVNNLSAGEKQRVSLARALAIKPKVLLLDEPLSALDSSTGKKLRRGLRKIHDRTGATTIHVTHNLEEANELADRIVVMEKGSIQQMVY
ncbi:ATP-binding cassette domain-containing protein, partial [bacterium]|nr:ATP-binding cassette domain-containing protein [bacterium]